MSALECRDLVCGYLGRTVLEKVDLSFAAGESVALLGVNGSGKSTLLQTLSRLIQPLSGSVSVGGENIRALSFAQLAKKISSVPQEEAATFPFLVREVVTMGRVSYGTGIFDTPEDRAHAENAMKIAGCDDLSERPITQLSGGERQRVWIARAIAQDTPVVLMDEPTSHLDVSHQLATASLARKLAAEGRCVVCAVHDLNLVAAIADRAILIDKGAVRLDGPVAKVLSSQFLDESYGVRFERVQTASGRLMLTPNSV
jgi:iron complex transport system ATP-binding protein